MSADRLVTIQLQLPAIHPLQGFESQTEILTSSYRFHSQVVLGFCAPGFEKDPNLGELFQDLHSSNNVWTLEVAVELPDLLPSIDGMSEAIVETRDAAGMSHHLCLSNRMSRFHFLDETTAYHALTPRTGSWHGTAEVKNKAGKAIVAAEEQLKTMAATVFVRPKIGSSMPREGFRSNNEAEEYFQNSGSWSTPVEAGEVRRIILFTNLSVMGTECDP